MTDPLYVGADRAGGAWLAVVFSADRFEEATVVSEVGELWHRYGEDAALLLADVPIGLLEGGETRRAVETHARSVLGPRAPAVFTPPVREATRKQRYAAATRVHERKTGRGLTKQAFAIADAIAAVDELHQEFPEARGVLREAHTEVCFRAFAGEPLQHSKTLAAGYAERMRALAGFDRDAPRVIQRTAAATTGHEVAVDDVLDAVALAYTARPGPGELRTLPPDPPIDATGLPMEMVYRADAPLE